MSTDAPATLQKLLNVLDRLQHAKICYRLEHVRDALMVEIAVPGEKWEIEFFADGHVEVERFHSDGKLGGGEMLETLFREFSD